jgi:hypothetical protein
MSVKSNINILDNGLNSITRLAHAQYICHPASILTSAGNRPVKKVNTTCTRRLTIAAVTVRKSAHKETRVKTDNCVTGHIKEQHVISVLA